VAGAGHWEVSWGLASHAGSTTPLNFVANLIQLKMGVTGGHSSYWAWFDCYNCFVKQILYEWVGWVWLHIHVHCCHAPLG